MSDSADRAGVPGDPLSSGEVVARALGEILRRSSRARVYAQLTEGLGPALDAATYPVLSGLDRTGPRTAAQLAADIGLDRSVVSRHADRLEAGGLLRRAAHPDDRRATLLSLTPDGVRAIAEMRRRLAARLDAYLATWPQEEAEAFARALARFTAEGLTAEPER